MAVSTFPQYWPTARLRRSQGSNSGSGCTANRVGRPSALDNTTGNSRSLAAGSGTPVGSRMTLRIRKRTRPPNRGLTRTRGPCCVRAHRDAAEGSDRRSVIAGGTCASSGGGCASGNRGKSTQRPAGGLSQARVLAWHRHRSEIAGAAAAQTPRVRPAPQHLSHSIGVGRK